MNIIDKVSMNVDFQENEGMPLSHGALQSYVRAAIEIHSNVTKLYLVLFINIFLDYIS